MASLDRPDIYVIARFLERLWRGKRLYGKTELQVAVGLNYDVFRKYLDWMLKKGFVSLTEAPEGTRIGISPKGVAAYETVVAWIRETMGDSHL